MVSFATLFEYTNGTKAYQRLYSTFTQNLNTNFEVSLRFRELLFFYAVEKKNKLYSQTFLSLLFYISAFSLLLPLP